MDCRGVPVACGRPTPDPVILTPAPAICPPAPAPKANLDDVVAELVRRINTKDDGKKNEDYFAYGKEIRATADGTETTVVDGIHDNVPGTMSPSMLTGNLVIVKHADDLYSAYAHLQPGKMRVKIGAKVKRGAVLGRCGNSGNSSEAHLHFQLQDGPLFEQSWGVEPIFKDVSIVRAGQPTKAAEYTFLKSDRVGEPTPK